jgi:hypothetical protein
MLRSAACGQARDRLELGLSPAVASGPQWNASAMVAAIKPNVASQAKAPIRDPSILENLAVVLDGARRERFIDRAPTSYENSTTTIQCQKKSPAGWGGGRRITAIVLTNVSTRAEVWRVPGAKEKAPPSLAGLCPFWGLVDRMYDRDT